jgi:hypothetical protein
MGNERKVDREQILAWAGEITPDEVTMLRDQRKRARKQWIVRRFGDSAEKRASGRFAEIPKWADEVYNEVTW